MLKAHATRKIFRTPNVRMFGGMMGMEGKPVADPVGGKINLWESDDRASVQLALEDKPGILLEVMQIFHEHKIN